VSNPEAAERPAIDPRLGLQFVAAAHLIDLFEGGPVDTNLARDMAHSAIDAYSPQSRADCLNAARTIAFSIAALTLLSRIVRESPPLPEQLQAFDCANALNSSADRSERTMMLRRRTQKTRPSPAPTASQPEPDAQAAPAEEAEVTASVAEARKNDHAAAAAKQADRRDTAAADQPFETRLEAALRSYIAAFETPTPETAPLKQTLLRNTAMPAMAAQTPARHAA
jgi:hypothetical protein